MAAKKGSSKKSGSGQATSSTAGPNAVFSRRPGPVSGKPQFKNPGNSASKQVSI